jgi:hypothetical protein
MGLQEVWNRVCVWLCTVCAPLTWLVAPQLNAIPQLLHNCVLGAFVPIAEGRCLPC